MGEKKQQFHLEPDRGLLNDPNGLAYYKGKYYVFFQWNRFSKDHSYKEWGMFTSADMVRWTFEGSALLPDQTYDMCGIYSGSGLVINDRLYLFYTGNVKKDGRRESHQCMAVTENGKKFLKLGSIAETPPGFTSHFRDPKIFRTGAGGYCMVTGAQRENGKGALALFRSDDALSWTYAGTPALSEDYEMIECPDLFRLDGRYVLLYCPQNRDNENDRDIASFSAAKLVEFDEQSGMLNDGDLDQDFFRPDYGIRFLCAPDLRRRQGPQDPLRMDVKDGQRTGADLLRRRPPYPLPDHSPGTSSPERKTCTASRKRAGRTEKETHHSPPHRKPHCRYPSIRPGLLH